LNVVSGLAPCQLRTMSPHHEHGRSEGMTQTNLTRPQGLNRIDPVLRETALELGVVEFRAETLPAEREHANLRAAQRAAVVDTDGVAVESRSIAGPDGQQLGLRLYRGLAESPVPVAVYAHGGAFVTGNLDTDHAQCVELARAAGCLMVSVDYRLAPENPCPAALDDVEAALRYAVENCAELDADAGRVAVMGRDAGAALVAGLTQRMFDQEGPQSWCRSCTSRCSIATPRPRGASSSAPRASMVPP